MENLKTEELETLREMLTNISEELESKLYSEFKPIVIEENEHKDSVDAANEQSTVSHTNRMRNREMFYLKKVKQALVRMQDGTYGICEECDCNISLSRLKARPTTEYCVVCKEEAEGVENHSASELKPKSVGRTMAQTI